MSCDMKIVSKESTYLSIQSRQVSQKASQGHALFKSATIRVLQSIPRPFDHLGDLAEYHAICSNEANRYREYLTDRPCGRKRHAKCPLNKWYSSPHHIECRVEYIEKNEQQRCKHQFPPQREVLKSISPRNEHARYEREDDRDFDSGHRRRKRLVAQLLHSEEKTNLQCRCNSSKKKKIGHSICKPWPTIPAKLLYP